ncbi:hypothetical protein FNF31_03920 [Cafeteria roenbergensis]|uniref:DNA-directed RNA polymerase III subunit RPC4 n=1 Tax=Cafeteria roenbergensis TaxID=33653 RepID=A0A5A8D7D7_CAFRO|nr:hypothetical protein FNF31_03920 [Cafeteria roenbergensis]
MSGQGSAPGLGGVGLSSAGRGGKARRRFTPKTPKAAAPAAPAAGSSSSSAAAARSDSSSRKPRDHKSGRGGRGRGRGGPGGGRGGRGRGGAPRGRVALPFGRVAFAAGGSGSGAERGPSAVLGTGTKPRSGGTASEDADGVVNLGADGGDAADRDGEAEEEEEEEEDSWPPVFVPGDAARPVTLPFYRLDPDAEISGGTELLVEARQQQAAASAQAAGQSGKAVPADKPRISKAMRRLPVAPRIASEQFSDPSICMDSFLGGSSGQLPKLFLMQLPTRLPLQPEHRPGAGGSSSSSSSSAAAASAAFGGAKAAASITDPPTFSHAATLAFSASSNPELTTEQRAAVRVKAAAEYAEATADPQGSAAALRDIGGGRIGEVLLYRSGKCVLKVGDALFDLSKGINNRQLQQAVQIKGAPTVDWRLPGVAVSPDELAEPGAKKKSASSSSSGATAAKAGSAGPADDPTAAGARFVPLGDIDHKLIATPQPETLARILVHGARSAPQDVSEDELSEDEQDAAEVEAPATAAGGDSDDSDSEAA